MDVDKIIEDYVNCSDDKPCDECEAVREIGNTGYTCCKLLTDYRDRLKDKINDVIEKN